MGIEIDFIDHKGESARLINRYGDAVAIFRPHEEPVNYLEPIGPSAIYWSALFDELSQAFPLRPETRPELVDILLRIERGMAPGTPYPSLKDFERILFRLAKERRK